jgi:hypothetical protein
LALSARLSIHQQQFPHQTYRPVSCTEQFLLRARRHGQDLHQREILALATIIRHFKQLVIIKQEPPICPSSRPTSPIERTSGRHGEFGQSYGSPGTRYAISRRLHWRSVHGKCEGAWRGERARKRQAGRRTIWLMTISMTLQ